MITSFKTLFRKPPSLTDRYDEAIDDAVDRLLKKPAAELNWNDFNLLFAVGLTAATYEEGVYFLPEAFAFLRRVWRKRSFPARRMAEATPLPP
jgi:hypothetical protein